MANARNWGRREFAGPQERSSEERRFGGSNSSSSVLLVGVVRSCVCVYALKRKRGSRMERCMQHNATKERRGDSRSKKEKSEII